MSFPLRGLNLVESVLRHDENQLRRFIRRMSKLNLNTLMTYYDYGWKRYETLIIEETCRANIDLCLAVFGPRTFFSYTNWKPDWFAKNPDDTPMYTNLKCETKPCRFQPEAVEAYKFGASQWLKNLHPEIKHVHVRSGDGTQFCECEQCRKLPEQDRWQPFVDAFLEALLESRPEMSFEVDVYVRRFHLPSNFKTQRRANRIMFDTFFRQPFIPLGRKSWNTESLSGCTSETNPDADSPNEYLYNRLRDWNSAIPNKVHVHENLMGQGLLTVNQHNTSVLIEDLKTYHAMGLRGVCYEAYEPGFEHFTDQISILAKAMDYLQLADDYKPEPLEKELTNGNWRMTMFCNEQKFQIDKYIEDAVVRRHVKNYRNFLNNPNAEHLRHLVEFVFEHEKRFDPLFAGFHGCDYARVVGGVKFPLISEETRFMLSHRKLWDFMETIPEDEDPRKVTRELIFDAISHAKNR